MTISSFSEMLRKKAQSYEVEARRNRELIDEWLGALSQLFAQLRDWLAASDPGRILQIEEHAVEVYEPNIGRYLAPRLNIRAFGIGVGIIPKARKTAKTVRPPLPGTQERSTGRVDITDEIRRYVLYRFSGESGDAWFIEDPASYSLQPLSQDVFENALMSYFQ